jgi:hypothetical protein
MPPIGTSLQQRLQRPENRYYDRDADDHPQDPQHEADDDLQRDRDRDDQDDASEQPPDDLRPSGRVLNFSLHALSVPRPDNGLWPQPARQS